MGSQQRPRGARLRGPARQIFLCLLCGLGLSLVYTADFLTESCFLASFEWEPGLSNTALWAIASLSASLIAIVLSFRRETFARRGLLLAVALCAVVGFTAVEAGALDRGILPASLTMLACLSFAGVMLTLMWLELVSRFESAWIRRAIVSSILFEALQRFAIEALGVGTMAFACMLYVLAIAVFLAMRASDVRCLQGKRIEKRHIKVRSTAFVGIVIVTLSANISLNAMSDPAAESPLFAELSLAAVAVVMWLMLVRPSFPRYSALIKLVLTMFISAFIAFASVEMFSPIAQMLAFSAGALFWFAVVLLATETSSYAQIPRTRLLASVYAVLASQGFFAAMISSVIPEDTAQAHVMYACVAVLLVLAALWLVGERDVSLFLLGEQVDPPHNLNMAGQVALASERFGLTAREEEVLGLYAQGRSAPFIAEQFGISQNTVKSHLSNIYAKMGVHSRQELISSVSGLTRTV